VALLDEVEGNAGQPIGPDLRVQGEGHHFRGEAHVAVVVDLRRHQEFRAPDHLEGWVENAKAHQVSLSNGSCAQDMKGLDGSISSINVGLCRTPSWIRARLAQLEQNP
jgi:hypothetical protein